MTTIWGTGSDTPLGPLSPWDVVTVGGIALPGVARVAGPGVEYHLEEKKTPGMHGATVTDHGRTLAKFTITLSLSSQADWDGYEATIPLLQPVRTVNGKQELEAVSVSHPAINVYKIAAVKFRRLGIPKPGAVIGTFEVELECWEHKPPKAMPAKGTATKSVKALEEPTEPLAPLVDPFNPHPSDIFYPGLSDP